MADGESRPMLSTRAWRIIGVAILIGLFVASLVVESCDTEKIQVCDTKTGECEYSSSCKPLLLELLGI